MYSGHKVWKLGITNSVYLTCFSIGITNWIEWFESPHARGRATYWAEMGWLLQAATTNNLSGKREESTENWFLFSSHSHTDTIQRICDLTEWIWNVCVAWGKEESNTYTGQIMIPVKGTWRIPVTRPPRPWDEEQGMLIVFDDKIRWNLRVWTL